MGMESSKLVLIVDDDTDCCANLKDILLDKGFRADIAYDGASALNLVSSIDYDIALLDFKMPGMNGAELFSKIRELSPRTIGILVTAFSGPDGSQNALDAGVSHVLRKPVEISELLALIHKHSCSQKSA